MTETQDRARLRKLIEEAFADVQYPGDADLVEPHCPECQGFSAAFRGKRWLDYKNNPLALLGVEHQEAFAFFTPLAFRHYLPLGMLATVDFYDKADLLPQSLALHLSPPADDRSWYEARLSLLTPHQLRAAAAFLRFLKERHGDDLSAPSLAQIEEGLRALETRLARQIS